MRTVADPASGTPLGAIVFPCAGAVDPAVPVRLMGEATFGANALG
jgi:hypothetical protein